MFLFFDRIYTGAPNITGSWGHMHRQVSYTNGCYIADVFQSYTSSVHGLNWNNWNCYFDSSRVSNQYQNSVNEIRMKNITSKGFIKLF